MSGLSPSPAASRGHNEVPSERDRVTRPLYSAGTGSCAFTTNGIFTETEAGELLKYDAQRVGSAASMARIRGTVLASWYLWLHVALYFLLAGAVCAAVLLFATRPELIDATRLREVVSYFSLLVAAALALHTHLVVERWWEVRSTMLGGLWCAINDLTMVLAAHFPLREHRRLKTLILRYCLLSVELMFIQARGGGTSADLDELCRRQLLRSDEREKLEMVPAKAQVVWVWIASTFQRLAEDGKLPSQLLVTLYGDCMKARGALGGIFTHLDTQLPFSYVHLISVVVHANCFMVELKCGTIAAIAVRNLQEPEHLAHQVSGTENLQVLLLQVFAATAVPVITLGLLEVGIAVSEPFGTKFEDFPCSAYHVWMRDECEAFQTAAEEAPREITHVADKVEVQDRRSIHGCVTIV